MLRRVDFPAPFGPSSPVTPGPSENEMSLTATTLPYQRATWIASSAVTAGSAADGRLAAWGLPGIDGAASLAELLRRPELDYARLAELDPAANGVPEAVRARTEVEVKYAGYIRRQLAEIEEFQHLERMRLPADFDYAGLPGLSNEIVEKLTRIRPQNLGQAGRISGVTPAAVTALMYYLKKRQHRSTAGVRETNR